MKKMQFPLLWALLCFGLMNGTNVADAQTKQPAASKTKSIPVRDALKKITKDYGTRFVYDEDQLEGKTTSVNLDHSKNMPIEDVLKSVLYPSGLVFLYVKSNYYTVVPKDWIVKSQAAQTNGVTPSNQSSDNSNMPVANSQPVNTKRIIRGQVTEPDGKGIADITITAKGNKTIITTTDAGGNYAINLPEGATKLTFTSVGYEDQSIPIGNEDVINVYMKVKISALAEVVVIGYGEQKKTTLTGSVASVSGKELQESPGVNLTQLLGGKLPGLIAMNKSGQPGSDDATLYIRGLSTTGDNTPLIVIDGIPRASFSFIDVNDVESVSLLKDASAVAVYGSRAANGVILITTKRGVSGKTSFTYTGNVGIQKGIRLIPTLDSYNTALLWNEAWQNEGTFAPSTGGAKGYDDATLQIIKNQTNPDRYSNTDWYKQILGSTAMETQHNLSINGGGNKARYFVSAGYADQMGFYSANEFKRYNIRANLDANIADNLEFALNISARIGDVKNSSNGQLVQQAFMTPRIEPVQYTNGTYHYDVPWVGNAYLASIGQAGLSRTNTTTLENSMSLNYKLPFVKGLSVKGLVAFDKTFTFGKRFTQPYVSYILNDDNSYTARPVPSGGLASLTESYAQAQSLTAEASVKYSRIFNKHSVNALLLYTQTQNSGDNLGAARINFPSPILDQLAVGSTVGATNSGTGSQSARQGVVGRFGYAFDNKYIFDFSFRYDGSDVFPPGQRYGFFPSVSGAWRISEEKFFKEHMKFVDNLKLRASWGEAGNDRVGQFQYLNTYTIGAGAAFGGGPGAAAAQTLVPGILANNSFTWEKAVIQDIGLEATLWKGLLSMEADYFYKRTKDILATNAAIPVVIGGTLPSSNIATVDSRGFELMLSHQNTIGKVKYHISANVTFAANKVISYPDPASASDALKLTGKPVQLNALIGYLADGLYQSAGDITNGPTPLFTNVAPGDIKYVDVDKNGVLNASDKVIITNGNTPGMIYGINTGFSYAGFDFNAFFQGAGDTREYIYPVINNSFYAGYQTLYPFQLDRWTPGHTNATFPRVTVTRTNNQQTSSYWVRNADYLRLKTLELGYTLPAKITRLIRSGPVRIYLNGSNLFTISKLKIVDPELGNDGNANSYPLVEVFNAGLSIKF